MQLLKFCNLIKRHICFYFSGFLFSVPPTRFIVFEVESLEVGLEYVNRGTEHERAGEGDLEGLIVLDVGGGCCVKCLMFAIIVECLRSILFASVSVLNFIGRGQIWLLCRFFDLRDLLAKTRVPTPSLFNFNGSLSKEISKWNRALRSFGGGMQTSMRPSNKCPLCWPSPPLLCFSLTSSVARNSLLLTLSTSRASLDDDGDGGVAVCNKRDAGGPRGSHGLLNSRLSSFSMNVGSWHAGVKDLSGYLGSHRIRSSGLMTPLLSFFSFICFKVLSLATAGSEARDVWRSTNSTRTWRWGQRSGWSRGMQRLSMAAAMGTNDGPGGWGVETRR